ncbi:F-box/kelch-repeat protein At3g23880-like [Ipomoea triloba]|uniref:F-box/kelch-repeat protein At3g23880-like n=1 Tax=Ipomoea triloba TaxID=35885 RepID=UPI00125DF39B|nr:F-box/kelch-repeat protein At3g23880-like [Ipomoea triloba]
MASKKVRARANSMADQGNNNSSTVLPDCSLPGDIMEEILLRLPVKVLLRFLSVSKSCYAFLKGHAFTKTYSLSNLHRADLCALILDCRYRFPMDCFLFNLSVLRLDAKYSVSELSEIPLPMSKPRFVCSSNALVCVASDCGSNVCLWNPSTRNCRSIAVPDSSALSSTCMKLGYIHEINEHMLLKVPIGRGHGAEEGPKLVWVYTFSLNYWRRKETTIPPFEWRLMESSVTLTLNGVMHWFKNYDRDTIISFDLMNDVFNSIAVPVSHCFPDGDFFISRDLVVLEGSLSVIAHPEYNDYAPGGYEIWVMKEYGIEESWTKKYSIPPFSTFTRPLRIWKANKLAFNSYYGIVDDGDEPIPILSEVLSYDLVTKSIEYFELPRQLKGYSHYYTRDFVESL